MRVTLVGHSSVLFEFDGFRILTDPYFGTWGNPAYARVRPPGRSREDLSGVDLVLLSHLHWDHVDRAFLRLLSPDVPVLAPRRSAWVARVKGARRVAGVAAWDAQQHGPFHITAVPATHIAASVGYVLAAGDRRAYFSGDTYHRPFMADVGRRFHLDLACIPVTTFRIPMTMGERAAVDAVRDLGADAVLPIHRDIQPRSPLLRTKESVEGFERRLKERLPEVRVIDLANGETIEI